MSADTLLAQKPHYSHPEKTHYLNHTKGFKSWALTLDHKRIGLMYLVGTLAAFALGGFFAIALRTELAGPDPLFKATSRTEAWDLYNQMFTLHGAIMVFLFIIPVIPAAIGNFVLPLMLGAKDVAFPRLNLASFYLWIIGALFFVLTLVMGGLDTGWTFYTPYSLTTNTSVVSATFGAFILGFSSILTGLNFITSIHMLRPKGMTWFRMPLLLWALYSTSVIQILATPVLAITLLLLMAERLVNVGIFDPKLGGDPILYQHFFWFYSHPAVYIMILPALGVISEIISTHSRKHIFGYSFIAMSSIAIALLSFIVWGHHMFTSGQSPLANAVFSVLTFSVAIPSAIKVFNWMATIYKGSIALNAPMIYALEFIMLFTIGGLTGLFLGTLAMDIHMHDTYFVVAHFHYVMVGSTLWAVLGGIYHWWPKMFGKMYNEKFAIISSLVVFLGFNLTFFPQFVAGMQGMPRRYASYVDGFEIFHQLSTVGSYILLVGLVMVLVNWIISLRTGKPAPANPWGSNTLEWHCSSPPPHDNFDHQPEVGDPYDYHLWHYDESRDGFVFIEEADDAADAGAEPGTKPHTTPAGG